MFDRVKLVISDVDGTMTDGRRYYGAFGEVMKVFDARDGMGIRLLKAAGVDFIMMSGSNCPATKARADELGVRCDQGVVDKAQAVDGWLTQFGLKPDEVIFVGDDLNDLPAFRRVFGVAVADAADEVAAAAQLNLASRGGHGAIRELADRILAELELDTEELAKRVGG